LIADTFLVLDQGAEILTRGVTRAYGDISYFLDEADEDETAAIEVDKSVITKENIQKEKPVTPRKKK